MAAKPNQTAFGGIVFRLCFVVLLAYAADKYIPRAGEKFVEPARAQLIEAVRATEAKVWRSNN